MFVKITSNNHLSFNTDLVYTVIKLAIFHRHLFYISSNFVSYEFIKTVIQFQSQYNNHIGIIHQCCVISFGADKRLYVFQITIMKTVQCSVTSVSCPQVSKKWGLEFFARSNRKIMYPRLHNRGAVPSRFLWHYSDKWIVRFRQTNKSSLVSTFMYLPDQFVRCF